MIINFIFLSKNQADESEEFFEKFEGLLSDF